MDLYTLLGKLPVPVEDVPEWARWMTTADRQVARDVIDGFVVSTVFLGLDHSMGGGDPLLFETMVFDGAGESRHCRRCSTWDQAIEQHRTMLDQVKGERGHSDDSGHSDDRRAEDRT